MLVDIPLDEVPNFIEKLKKELDQSLFVINFIETCAAWKRKNDQLQISLLYTEHSTQSGVFIGIIKSGCQGSIVTMYAFDGHESDLEQALNHLRMDWRTVVNFDGICQKHEPIIKNFITDKSLKIEQVLPLVMLCMAKEEALKIDIQCPDDVFFAPLKEYHTEEMYEIWRCKDSYTIDELKNSIKYNNEAAWGIFCKNSGQILTRCVRSHSGLISALQTVEKAKNKGYAKLLLKYVTKKIAEKGILPCSYVADLNKISLKVHFSTGYQNVARCSLYIMETML